MFQTLKSHRHSHIRIVCLEHRLTRVSYRHNNSVDDTHINSCTLRRRGPIPAERLSQCSHTRSRRILELIIISVPWLSLQMCVWDSETETQECVGTRRWWCQFSFRPKNVQNKMREGEKQGNNSRKSSSLPSGFSQQFRLQLHWQIDYWQTNRDNLPPPIVTQINCFTLYFLS